MNARLPGQLDDVAALVGRVLLGAIFVWGGYGKAMAAAATTAYFGKLGLPLPAVAYAVAVAIELAGGLMIVTGLFTRWVAIVLAVWCIATALVAHSDFGDRNMLIHFLKNVSMAGGFLYVVVLGAGAYSLDRVLGRGLAQDAGVAAPIAFRNPT